MSDTFLGETFSQPARHLPRLTTLLADTKSFLSPSFDPNAYANAVLSGTRYTPDTSSALADQPVAGPSRRAEAKGDVGLELARLNHGIVC